MPYNPMTRPRISGREFSWSVELPVIMNTMDASPIGTSRTSSDHSVGATATSTVADPNTTEATARRRGLGSRWRVMRSAPRSEPTPITDSSVPSSPAPPPKTRVAMSGNRIEKLKENM